MKKKRGRPKKINNDARPISSHELAYARKKADAARRSLEISRAGREIGEIPVVVNIKRRDAARKSFRFFCEAYFAETFYLPWSLDHLKIIAKIELAALHGGLFAMAMPRGSGKTSIVEAATLWVMLYGLRFFVALIGSTEKHALNMLESIKSEIENNERLAEDFPEVAWPIQKLGGIALRAKGQLHDGERTRISWTGNELILPTIADSLSSGAVVRCAGITGQIRGMKYKRADGQTVRPDFVVIDDPQTDESAKSASQCETREAVLQSAIVNLAGPGKKISGIMPCTVISPGDVADNFLDQKKHPDWQGERTKMIYAFPKNEKLWNDYTDVLADSYRDRGNISAATAFYEANRTAMDEGAVVAWSERFNHDELSAVQHAMNLRIRDEAAFFAEYQNEPKHEVAEADILKPDILAAKLNNEPRRQVPIECDTVVAFIDVGEKLSHYVICAVRRVDFGGAIIDYGAARMQAFPSGKEATIFAGISALVEKILGCEYITQGKTPLAIQRCLIDAGDHTQTIYQLIRQSKYRAILMPSMGVGVQPGHRGLPRRRPGVLVGHNWTYSVPTSAPPGSLRLLQFDANFWKSFFHARMTAPMGADGCMSLWGASPREHRQFADHCCAEFRVRVEDKYTGQVFDLWRARRVGEPNHFLDCVVGCCVAASFCGASLRTQAPIRTRRSRGKWSRIIGEIQI